MRGPARIGHAAGVPRGASSVFFAQRVLQLGPLQCHPPDHRLLILPRTTPCPMSDSEDQFEYEDDDYVDEDDDDDYRIDSEDEEHIEFEEARRDESVKVFEEDQLLVQQHEVMKRVSELLNITPSAACCLLRHFKWNYDELSQKYFEDPDGLRGSLGLDLGTTKPFSEGSSHTQANCNICFDEVPGSDLIALKCGHWFCRDCWSQYLQSKIDDGPSCVTTHCPYPKCQLAVDELLFQEVCAAAALGPSWARQSGFDGSGVFVLDPF